MTGRHTDSASQKRPFSTPFVDVKHSRDRGQEFEDSYNTGSEE